MTNCPNCGAPYKLNSRICEYCGTVREESPEQIRAANELEQVRVDVEQAKHEFLTLRLQAAQQAQYDHITANAGIVFTGNVNNVKNIQVTHKTVELKPVEPEKTDKQLSERNFLTPLLLLLALTLLGRFVALHTKIEILKSLCGWVYSGGIVLFSFVFCMSALLWWEDV